jgi:hypothetical protein
MKCNVNVTFFCVLYFMVLAVALDYTVSDGRISLICPIHALNFNT